MEQNIKNDVVHNKATFAIYKTKTELKKVIEAFRKLGFRSHQLSFYQPNEYGSKDFSQVQKNQVFNGAYVGFILGMLAIGCAYLFIGSGIVTSGANNSDTSVVNNIIGGTFAVLFGGLVGAACGTLVGIGTPDPLAKRYGQYLNSGGILVSIETNNPYRAAQAKKVLEKMGGNEVHLADEVMTWNGAIEESAKISQEEDSMMYARPPIHQIGKDIDAERHPEEQIVPKWN